MSGPHTTSVDPSARLADDVLVVSPHCDDAVLSLGGLLAARKGLGRTTVLTVLAGDPRGEGPPGPWDRKAGFASPAEATRARRAEDLRACRGLGARAVHLDGTDEQYADRLSDEELWQQLEPALGRTGDVLLPGHPLRHLDHRRVAALVLSRLDPQRLVRLYAEEPYATWAGTSPGSADSRGTGTGSLCLPPPDGSVRPTDLLRGLRAAACYRSQLVALAEYVPRAGRTSPGRLLGRGPSALLLHLGRAGLRTGQAVSAPIPAADALAALGLEAEPR